MAINWDKAQYASKGTGTKSQSSINWDKVEYIPSKIAAKKEEIEEAQKAYTQERILSQYLPAPLVQQITGTESTQAKNALIKPAPVPLGGMTDFRKLDQASVENLPTSVLAPEAARLKAQAEGIKPVKYEETIRLPESTLKDPRTQFVSGAYEGSNIARAITAMMKMSGHKAPLIARMAEESQPYQTGARTAGKLYGGLYENIAMYGTLGKAAEGWSALEGIKSPFLRNLAGQQLADTLIQTPGVVIQGVAEQKPVGEVLKDVGKQQASDLAYNLLFGVGEKVIKAILNKLKAGKLLTQSEIEVVNNTPELRALPEAKQYLALPEAKTTTEVIEGLPPKPKESTLANVLDEPVHPRFSNTAFSSEPNKLYREVGPDRLLAYVDNIAYDAPYGAFPNELYVTKSPELALGQGTNRGIMLQFSDENVPLVRNTKIVFNPENGEYLVDAGTRDARDNMIPLRHNLEKVTINKDLLGDITQADLDLSKQYAINKAQLNRVTIPTFEARGWKKSFDVEGNLILTNPKLQKAKEIYETAEQNIIHTVPEQYRRETPFTVFRSSEPPKVQSQYAREVFTPIGGESARDVAKSADIPPIGGKVETPQARIYGEQPKGEIPEGMKERGFSRNIRTDTAMPDDIRQLFDEEPLAYKQISNQTTLAKAERIMEQGEEAATAEFYRSIGAKKFEPETVPLAKLLAKQANEAGNVAKAREILSATAEKLTEAGQFSQAAKILREADPETFLMTIDKQIRKLNKQGLKQYGKKWTNIDLLPDEITAIKSIPRGNQQAYEEVWEQIGNRIAKELPSTKMEKFDAWRRMAMLLNPKTHIRNTVGNVIMSGMRKVSDTIGAGLEKLFGVKTGERTKSFGWSLNKNIASKVDETWDIVKKDILGESRWEIDNLKSLGREKRIFNKGLPTKAVEAITGHKFDRGALQWVNELSLKTLNAEDNVFAKRAFKDALGQFMQANKLDVATDAAIEYAKRRALEATFKQTNKVASWLNEAKRVRGAGILVEAAVPFTKTPANIAKSAFEYSPAGLTKLLFSKGKPPAEIIETLSKGLTGSGIFALGMWLNSLGWARAGKKRSGKAEALLSEAGEQQYSLLTPQGSYTIDWAQPFAIPFFMGVAMSEYMREKDTIDYETIMDGIARGGDTFFYMSMLQEVKRILGAGSTTGEIIGLPWSYVQQAWPAVFGQTARTIDPIRRSTYDPNWLKQTWNIIQSRTPYIGVDWLPSSKKLEPALDIWGREQSQGGALQQFINPGYAKERSSDPVTNEVARLYGEFKDTDMLPKANVKSFTDKGIEYRLTAEQVTELQRKMGQENYNDIARLISSAEYQKMTDEQKAKKIEKIVDKNYEEAKKDIIKASAIGGK